MKKFLSVLATLPFLASPVFASDRLSGAGATFPSPLYTRWFRNYYKETGNRVNYQATGSGSGIRQFFGNTLDFGASDDPITKDSSDLIQIPITAGAVVPAYNKPGCDLKITQFQLADVYLGKITDWKDLGCESGKITPIFRSDGSGTTAVFTASLAAFSPEWELKVGHGKSVQWPIGIGSKGNAGVAGSIKQTPGAIGYLNYSYVRGGKQQEAAIQNKAGNYVKATKDNTIAGLSEVQLDDRLIGTNSNPAGDNSYPIISYTWILARPEHPKNDAMKRVFKYMLKKSSQDLADTLGYIPLPESIRLKCLETVEFLK
jgi:phosphate transport system substrate-binding protein